jgi:[methyl-Co(III) methanol-specific corrinoid protein]:coenzyme M methyltransferase
VLNLFKRQKVDYIPVFSGQGNISLHGLAEHGWNFPDIHSDARKMATAAASTYRLFGFECAVVPFDVGVEAEALGSKLNYYPNQADILYPTVSQPLAEKVTDLNIRVPSNLREAGRIPIVREALRLLKKDIGDEVAVGSYVLGPYTLAGQLVDLSDLSKSAHKKRDLTYSILETLADALIEIIGVYEEAGADYISIREMGAGPDILSPRLFESLILPNLQKVFSNIDIPNVLHLCGDTNMIVDLMAQAGADALSVEKKNDIVETRKKMGSDALIFGDLDGFGLLVEGTPADVEKGVKEAIEKGVNAVWPGCDIWPTVPKENMEAMMAAARKYGKLGQG